MAHRTTEKPAKPYAEFPLFPHATGRWAKKIRGRLVYFGPWRDPDGALDRYLAQKDDLYAGRTPRVAIDGLTLADMCNDYLTAQARKLENGEVGPRTFHENRTTCERLVTAFGRDRLVDDLASDDFGQFRSELAKTRRAVALANEIQRVRSVFKYGYEAGLIDKPVRFGPEFKKPARRTVRRERHERGPRMFDRDEILALLDDASVQMRAMILLGINAGVGNTDIAEMPMSAVDLDRGVLDYPRPKTGVGRRATLWPETIEAIRAAIAKRPKPKDRADAGLMFVTKYGKRWVRFVERDADQGETSKHYRNDAIGLMFGRLTSGRKIRRDGCGFYALRHTLETIGGEAGDQAAVDRIMGHERDDMASRHYREWRADAREDERLRRVTDHVRSWLYEKTSTGNIDDAAS